MTVFGAAVLLLAATLQDPVAAGNRDISVQLGVSVSPDTVTVGQRFTVVIRARGPRGATLTFPVETDSASAPSPTATELIGKPLVSPTSDSAGTIYSAAYRFAAWDVGAQTLGLGNIIVVAGADTGYVSLADRTVFVRTVLPPDTTLHVPKPARGAILFTPFEWRPLLAAALALALATLLWRMWIWFRKRRERDLDPFSAAEREFDRIEAMGLIAAGAADRHAALMSDVLRNYLAERVQRIERSHTSSELLGNAGAIHPSAPGLGDLLWRTDLIKFANIDVAPEEAERLGGTARNIVRSVENAFIDREKMKDSQAA